MQIEQIAVTEAAAARIDFVADAAEFHAAAAFLSGKVVERRNTIPIVSMVKVEADIAGIVTLTATNLDQLVTVTIAAQVERPGAICIMADALADALAKGKKARDEARLTDVDGRAVLKCGRSSFKLPSLPVDDFPLTPTGAMNAEEALSVKFDLPAAQFLADVATLAPCISKDGTRYYLQGIALQRRDMAGRDSFVMVATDGSNLAVASRAMPATSRALPDMILPGAVAPMLKAAAKLVDCEQVAVCLDGAFGMGSIVLHLGRVTLYSTAIDGTFPQWERLFDRAAPTSENAAPMFPELLPGAPTAAIERMGKACPVSIDWEARGDLFMGTAPDDAGLVFVAMQCDPRSAGRAGFTFNLKGEGEAERYLLALASSHGLCSIEEMAARCQAITDSYGECDNDALNQRRAFGKAEAAPAKLVTRGARVLGLTISGEHKRAGYSENVTDWETLCEREEYHPPVVEAVEGSYSILMPADGPGALVAEGMGEIIGPDGFAYQVADDGRKIHLNKDQVRALIGESCFETIKLHGHGYICRWLYEQGDTRFLVVGKDGRAPKSDGMHRNYLTREEVDAVLAGGTVEPVAVEAEPIVEMDASAPHSIETPVEAIPAAHEPENVPTAPQSGDLEQSAPDADPLAAILARLDALEAMLATLPAEADRTSADIAQVAPIAVVRPKRTPAHERAIRRAWVERRERREFRQSWKAEVGLSERRETLRAEAMAAYNRSGEERRALRKQVDDLEGALQRATAKRRRAVLKARDLHKRLLAKREYISPAYAQQFVDREQAKGAETLAALAIARKDLADAQSWGEDQENRRRKARDDWRNAEARLATVTRERDAAHVALQAVQARAERAEEALAGVGDRLAAVEGAIQRQRSA